MESLKIGKKAPCDSKNEISETSHEEETIADAANESINNETPCEIREFGDKLQLFADAQTTTLQRLKVIHGDSVETKDDEVKEKKEKEKDEQVRKKQEFQKNLGVKADIDIRLTSVDPGDIDESVGSKDEYKLIGDLSGNMEDFNEKLEFIAGIPQMKRLKYFESTKDIDDENKNAQSMDAQNDGMEGNRKTLSEHIEMCATLKRNRKYIGEDKLEQENNLNRPSDECNDFCEDSLDVIEELNEDKMETLAVPNTTLNRLSLKSVESIVLLQDEPNEETAEEDDYMYHYDEKRRQTVTKTHYIAKEDRGTCQSCSTPFTSLSFRRPHHCRRCGDIFCGPCLLYRKKLNVWAQPDNGGILCKVCLTCYSETEQVLFGIKRSITEDFVSLRRQCKTERRHILVDVTLDRRNGSVVPAPWKEQFHIDIPQECVRLLSGFQQAVGSSDAQKALHEMTQGYLVPSWQRAKYWTLESVTMSCRECGKKLKTKKHRNCRVCALALCKKCSYKELLIYYEDGTRPSKDTTPRLAVIKIKGSPELEPRYSLRLSVCKDCRDYLIERQQENPDWFVVQSELQDPDLVTQLLEYDRIFRELITEIHQDMGKVREIHEPQSPEPMACPDVTEAPTTCIKNETPGPIDTGLIKERLNANLNKYYEKYQILRNIVSDKASTASRPVVKLTRNYLLARNNFYIKYRARQSSVSIEQK